MISPNEVQVIYPIKSLCSPELDEINVSIVREVSCYNLLHSKGVDCCKRPVSIFKNNDMIVFVHPKLHFNLKRLMPKKDILQKHGIKILKMLLTQVYQINQHGFAHRDLHPGNVWVT
jgi:hypothetical protein